MRLFSIRGAEFYDYDSMQQLRVVDELFYSFGEDYIYTVRLNLLEFKKELGSGGFGTVNLMYDHLR